MCIKALLAKKNGLRNQGKIEELKWVFEMIRRKETIIDIKTLTIKLEIKFGKVNFHMNAFVHPLSKLAKPIFFHCF